MTKYISIIVYCFTLFTGCSNSIKNRTKIVGASFILFGSDDNYNCYFIDSLSQKKWGKLGIIVKYDLTFYQDNNSYTPMYDIDGCEGSNQILENIILYDNVSYDSTVICPYSYSDYRFNDRDNINKRLFSNINCYIKEFNQNTSLSSSVLGGENLPQVIWLETELEEEISSINFIFNDTTVVAKKQQNGWF